MTGAAGRIAEQAVDLQLCATQASDWMRIDCSHSQVRKSHPAESRARSADVKNDSIKGLEDSLSLSLSLSLSRFSDYFRSSTGMLSTAHADVRNLENTDRIGSKTVKTAQHGCFHGIVTETIIESFNWAWDQAGD